MSRRCLFPLCVLLLLAVVQGARAADSPAAKATDPAAALAGRVWAISEIVLDRHMDPPARQAMFLAAAQGLYQTSGRALPTDLARRVSTLTTKEQFTDLLRDAWPKDAQTAEAITKFENGALNALMIRLPGGGRLTPPEEVKIADQLRGNRYVGIGVQIRTNEKEKRPQLVTPLRGGPAHRAGLRPGDLLIEVDGKSTEGERLQPLIQRLRGDEGTTVTLVVRQPGEKETRMVKLTRTVVPFENVQGYRRANAEKVWDFRIEPDSPIAYATVRSITSSTLHELRQLDRRLRAEGAKALVLDLRLSAGGELQHCALVADGLLDSGTLWRVRDARGQVKERKADRDCLFRDMPIVVLVSGPARGVPWLVAALQDNGRAVIVGESLPLPPFAPSELDLPDGGKLLIATGRLERARKPAPATDPPDPEAEPDWMLQPDHVVTMSRKQRGALADWFQAKNYTELPKGTRDEPPEDPGVAKAVELLRAKLKESSSTKKDR